MLRRLFVSLILGLVLVTGTACATPSPEPPAEETRSYLVPPFKPGLLATDFTLETPDGDTISLSDYRGQVVLINFWATWCPSCKAEMYALEKYYAEHKADGFVVLAVNHKESAAAVSEFIEAEGLSFPVVLDTKGRVASAYNVTGIPISFYIDRDGELLGHWPGSLLHTMLEQTLTPIIQSE